MYKKTQKFALSIITLAGLTLLTLFLMPGGPATTQADVTGQQAETNTFTVTVDTKDESHPAFGQGFAAGFVIDGVQGKELTLQRGQTYTFHMSSVPSIHPFYISTSETGAGAGQYDEGVTGNQATGDDMLIFTPTDNTPDLLYYQCAAHPNMGWKINIVDDSQSTNFEVVANNLDNPRGLTFGSDGALYIAEAGRGGDGACITGPEGNQICYGDSGAVTKVMNGNQTRVITGLASLGNQTDGSRATGPHDLVFDNDGNMLVLIGLGNDPAIRVVTGTFGEAGMDFGQLIQTNADGSFEKIVDVAGYEATANPDGGVIDSNPYAIISISDGYLVADAGANALLKLGTGLTISTTAVFTTRMVEFNDNQVPMQAVPTSVVVGPDGAYYVSELTGFPFPVDGANIYRVVPGQEPDVYLTGFTNIIDLAFGSDGSLYVVEMFTNGMLSNDPTGAVIKVSPDGSRETIASDGLITPSAIAIGSDGALYVSNRSTEAGTGQVVRLPLEQHTYLPIVLK